MRLRARLQGVAAALTVAAAAFVTAGTTPAATASTAGTPGHAAAITKGQQLAAMRYWTRARMERAVPSGPGTSGLRAAARPLTPAATDGLAAGSILAAGSAAPLVLPAPLRSVVPPMEFLAARARIGAEGPAARRSRGPRPARPAAASTAAASTAAASTGAQWQGSGAVTRASGKIFFTLDGTDYVCSGAAVASANADVAVTAGHCASDGSGNWATNWTFVPGYSNGNAPYGRYTARRFFAPSQWTSGADENYDVAFVALNAASLGGVLRHVVPAAGGLGIAFGRQPARAYAFGYPSQPPYKGQQLYYCDGTTSPDPYHSTNDTGLDCVMTEGSSGGPWLSGFNPSSGAGTVTGVISFKYDDGSDIMYGTAFGSSAQSAYQQAEQA